MGPFNYSASVWWGSRSWRHDCNKVLRRSKTVPGPGREGVGDRRESGSQLYYVRTRSRDLTTSFSNRCVCTGWSTTQLTKCRVQIRLLPLLAATFALHFTGRGMMELYQENQKKMSGDAGKASTAKRGAGPEELNPGTDLLADLHATSCGLKALASTTAAEGLEVCRRACGGHGYSSFSGIGSWYADYLPTTTWEGDNYMLTQQVARYVS